MPTEDDLFGMVAAPRREVADLLDSPMPEQLATDSLCLGWTVKDVGTHLTEPADGFGPLAPLDDLTGEGVAPLRSRMAS